MLPCIRLKIHLDEPGNIRAADEMHGSADRGGELQSLKWGIIQLTIMKIVQLEGTATEKRP